MERMSADDILSNKYISPQSHDVLYRRIQIGPGKEALNLLLLVHGCSARTEFPRVCFLLVCTGTQADTPDGNQIVFISVLELSRGRGDKR